MLRTLITTTALALLALLTIACSLIQTPSSAPGVLVTAPPSASVYTVGETVAVQSTSTDPANIIRVTLIVDGVIVREDSGPVAAGQQQFSVVQTWTADKVGQHNLIVRATNGQGVTTEAGIYVTVQAAPVVAATAIVPINTATPIATATTAPATLALPPLPTQNPAITVIITATPQNTATPSPTAPVVATATRTLAPKTVASEIKTAAPTTALVATAVPPTAAPPLANAAACSGQPAAFTFTASKPTITAGQSVTLNWGAVTNASIATLSGGAFNALGVAAPAQVTTAPTATTTYTLTATCNNGGGTRTASVTVTVTAAAAACANPKITSFSLEPRTIASGETVTLSWVTTGADSVAVSLNGASPQSLAVSGSSKFTLTQTTNFFLAIGCSASPNATANPQSATVTVTPPATSCGDGNPKVNSFIASSTTIKAGELVTISWNVTGANQVNLNHVNVGNTRVELTGSRTYSLLQTTTFAMLAVCGSTGESAFAEVTVNVTGGAATCTTPVIDAFTATPSTLKSQEITTVNWSTTGADSVLLTSDFPPQTGGASGSLDFVVPRTITFVLTAKCSATNTSVSSQLTVTVTEGCSGKPALSTFTATKTNLSYGESATLQWGAATNADEFVLTTTEDGVSSSAPVSAPGGSVIGVKTKAGRTTLILELTARCSVSNTTATQQITLTWNP